MFDYLLTFTMIQFSAYIFLTAQVLVFIKADPLKGEQIFQADPQDFPFVVSFRQKMLEGLLDSEHFCTGSLITQIHVITAAHCFEERIESEIEAIIVGEYWIRPYVDHGIDYWLIYDSWARENGKAIEMPLNDIAIAKLSSPANREHITPVSLTNLNNKQLYGTKAMIIGWKAINEDSLTMVLLQGKVTILCPSKYERLLKLVANRIIKLNKIYLATFTAPYILASCGDSGGPLLDNNHFLLGVTRSTCPISRWGNFSEEFINQYKINLHSSVHYYSDFIENVTSLSKEQ
ncbi:serine protease 30-like [Phymastichus coffea]|uniref:serine protease 30-like n=1 Tax=Phymastichus coffea TaxID=108790 RepID=UPI00273CC15C|nr:serine protease 30-like [Phymastichus coffea]